MVDLASGTIVPVKKEYHSQYRRLKITINLILRNPNPPHIYDETDEQIENRLTNSISNVAQKTITLHDDGKLGFLHDSFIDPNHGVWVDVQSRECDESGRRTLWGKLRYLLRRRYWL